MTTLIYYDKDNKQCSQDFNDPEMAMALLNYLKINAPWSKPEIKQHEYRK